MTIKNFFVLGRRIAKLSNLRKSLQSFTDKMLPEDGWLNCATMGQWHGSQSSCIVVTKEIIES